MKTVIRNHVAQEERLCLFYVIDVKLVGNLLVHMIVLIVIQTWSNFTKKHCDKPALHL